MTLPRPGRGRAALGSPPRAVEGDVARPMSRETLVPENREIATSMIKLQFSCVATPAGFLSPGTVPRAAPSFPCPPCVFRALSLEAVLSPPSLSNGPLFSLRLSVAIICVPPTGEYSTPAIPDLSTRP